jgi:hypothetical protein
VGLYRRTDSRFWWMSYTWKGEQYFESTKCRSKALANKVLSKREGEIAMQMFKVGQQGERMSFTTLCKEFGLCTRIRRGLHFKPLSEER